jgi:phosphoribosylformylglycinamidine synthase
VSFYNQSKDYAVYPTPVIGMLGLVEDYKKVMTSYFKDEGDIIILLGKRCKNINGSEYLNLIHNKVAGDAPDIDLDEELNLQRLTLELIEKELIKSAHDVSDGGLAVSIAECCVINHSHLRGCKIGFEYKYRKDFELLGESQSRIIISADEDNIPMITEMAKKKNINAEVIGFVGGKCCIINDEISVPVRNLKSLYYETIENYMNE